MTEYFTKSNAFNDFLIARDEAQRGAFTETNSSSSSTGSAAETLALATLVVEAAYAVSIDRRADTPFARRYSEEMNLIYNGGKIDDIACAIGVVETAAVEGGSGKAREGTSLDLPDYSNV